MKKLIGILLVAISAASFGTLGIFGRYVYGDGMDIFTALFIRFGVSAAFMMTVLILRKERFPRGRILAQLIGMGAIGYVGQSFLYLTSIKYASVGLIALLLYLYPMFVFILSVIFLREKVTAVKVTALALSIVGAGLTVDPDGGQLLGAAMIIAAALVYSVYIVVGANVMKHVTAFQSSAVVFMSAGAVYGILTFANGVHLPQSATGWLAMLGMVVFSTIIAITAFLAGIKIIGPTNAAMLSTLEPVVTVLLAAWLFGERLTFITLLGGGLILAAVIILTRSELASGEKEIANRKTES
ncbi:MAG: DMT family transporter [Chloroflexi bacterium]|nr:DMT family transporter [Chloroflexota bacterium]MCA2000924.1 DMT family transporter [Chloroflexota bacterium]